MRPRSGRHCIETRVSEIHVRPQRRVAQVEVPSRTGIRDRRIHVAVEGNGRNWRIIAWLLRGWKASLRRPVGDGIHAGHAQNVARKTRAAGEKRLPVCRCSARNATWRALGQAGSCCADCVLNLDARQPCAAGGIQRAARRQASEGSGAGIVPLRRTERSSLVPRGAKSNAGSHSSRGRKGATADEGPGDHASRQSAGCGERHDKAATRRVLRWRLPNICFRILPTVR